MVMAVITVPGCIFIPTRIQSLPGTFNVNFLQDKKAIYLENRQPIFAALLPLIAPHMSFEACGG